MTPDELAAMAQDIHDIRTFMEMVIVLGGCVIAFIISYWFWRAIIKPMLRSYIKLPI